MDKNIASTFCRSVALYMTKSEVFVGKFMLNNFVEERKAIRITPEKILTTR